MNTQQAFVIKERILTSTCVTDSNALDSAEVRLGASADGFIVEMVRRIDSWKNSYVVVPVILVVLPDVTGLHIKIVFYLNNFCCFCGR